MIFSGLCGSPKRQKSKLKDNNLEGAQWRQKEINCNTFNNKNVIKNRHLLPGGVAQQLSNDPGIERAQFDSQVVHSVLSRECADFLFLFLIDIPNSLSLSPSF